MGGATTAEGFGGRTEEVFGAPKTGLLASERDLWVPDWGILEVFLLLKA